MLEKKSVAKLTSLIVASSLLLAACGGGKTETPPTPGQGAPVAPTIGGEVVYRVPSDPDTLGYYWRTSQYAADVIDRIFGDGLLRIGYDLKPEPALAEAMPTVSADQKTFTFKLRKGIKFHNGTEVKAEDIVFAYEIPMSKDYAGPFKSIVTPLESVKAVDEYTVEFKTKEVFAPFLFGTASLAPMPKQLLKDIPIKDLASNDFWKKPVGAGPFKFTEQRSGQYTLLTRNDQFWENGKDGVKGGKVGPFVQTFRVKVIPEETTSIAALEAGEITFMSKIEGDEAKRLKSDAKDKLDSYDWNRMGYGYQTFNNDSFPTNIKEVRQALSFSLNREAITQGLMAGQATVPPGFIPPIHWAFDKTVKGYTYDMKKAAELMEKAGFKKNAQGVYEKDGKPAKLKYVATKGSSIVEGIALQSQKDWKAAGFDIEVVMVDFNTLLDKHLKPGDFQVTFSGLNFSVDPHFSFETFQTKEIRLDDKGVNQGTNRARYKNTKVDELVQKGQTTVDVAERLKIYQEAQRLIIDDAPMNWVYVNKWTDFAQKSLKNTVNQDGYGLSLQYLPQWSLPSAK